jgi:hypothetical protein
MGTDNKQDGDVSPIEQDTIVFYGHPLVALRLEDGRICAVLRWLCDGLHLDPSGQIERIQRKTAISEGLIRVRVQTEGGLQVMPALTLDVLPGWLFGIDENRLKPEVREDVIVFQRECVRVLAEHFANKARAALPPPDTLVPAEPITQPERPALDAGRSAWIEYHHAMAKWLEWQDDIERWRAESSERQAALEQRQLVLEDRQDGLESRMEGVEELSRLFVEVTERLGPQTLTPQHQAAVKRMAGRLNELSGSPFAAIYGDLKTAFRVGKYSDIPEAEWERVVTWFQVRIASAEKLRKK